MTAHDPCTPSVASRLRRNFGALAFIAALSFIVPACGDESSNEDPSNNSSSNNNPANNNPANNNPANNNPVNNNPVNNNPVNNNPVNNNPVNNNPVNNNPDPIAECEAACMTLGTTCRDEFLAECPTEVVDQLIPGCQQACADENARAQITAVAGLPCATVVPLAIDGFGLSEACADEPDLCETVTCDEGETCDPADGMCKPDAVDLCENVTCDEGEICDPTDGMCKSDTVDLCDGVTCDEGLTCDPADGICKEVTCADAYEPNNTSDTASALTAEDQTIDNLGICLADRDFYTFTLPAGQSAQIAFFFSHAVEDIDVRATITRGDTSTTVTSVSSTDDEYLGIAAGDTEATVLVEAYVFQDSGENLYSMRIDIDPEGGACNTNAQCAEGSFCNAEKVCQEIGPCTTDDDCPSGLACDTVTSECVDCLDDNDCGFFETCDVATNTCVECATDDDCFGGDVCSAGVCVECTTNEQCDSALCNPDNTCAECTDDSQCDSGICNPDNTCAECATGDQCATGICNPDNTCAECADDFDCGFFETCDTVTNTCVECADDNDCFGGDVCNAGTCVECTTNEQCDSGLCLDDNSCAECVDDSQCPNGFACNASDFSCELTACDGTPDNNDTFTDAELIVPGTLDGVICGGESDWYAIEVTEGDNLSLELYFIDDLGDVELSLNRLSDDGTTTTNITSSVSSTDNEFISRNNLTAGTYYIRVYGVSGVSNTYTLITHVGTDFTACSTSTDCETGESCSTRRICIPTGTCEQNIDCPGSAPICDSNVCVECLTDDQCDSDLCLGDNTCAECTTDADCSGDDLCNLESYTCVECITDDNCDVGEVCTTDGFCAPSACGGVQPFEPNETILTAAPISAGTYDLAICGAESDWFALDVQEGDDIYVALEFIDDLGDIDVSLNSLSAQNTATIITSSVSTTDNEYIAARNLAAGTYYIRAYGFSNAQNTYTMTVDAGADLAICNTGADCAMGESCSPRKVCIPTGTCQDNADCTSASARICNLADNTCVGCIDNDDCSAPQACSEETLTCQCVEDSLGTINTRELAYSIDNNGVPQGELSICNGSSDFFAVTLEQGQIITVDALFTHRTGGDIELAFQNSTGTVLTSSTSSTNNERITYTATAAGTYYIRVYGFSGGSNAYTLQVDIQ